MFRQTLKKMLVWQSLAVAGIGWALLFLFLFAQRLLAPYINQTVLTIGQTIDSSWQTYSATDQTQNFLIWLTNTPLLLQAATYGAFALLLAVLATSCLVGFLWICRVLLKLKSISMRKLWLKSFGILIVCKTLATILDIYIVQDTISSTIHALASITWFVLTIIIAYQTKRVIEILGVWCILVLLMLNPLAQFIPVALSAIMLSACILFGISYTALRGTHDTI